jgi:hypothetical protein
MPEMLRLNAVANPKLAADVRLAIGAADQPILREEIRYVSVSDRVIAP